ncbi:MAG: TIGR01212 family radical SAM protein [Odoribacter sp.]|nr:TIGR01212 family radical SAM protein [Odoribacter sp.]
MEKKRYKDTPEFFRNVFGERVQKLSVDGGFTCPNRDGSKGKGGCIFCNNDSFNPAYCREVKGIYAQIEEGIRFFDAKYKGQKYLAYFQTYSNTYAPLEVLKKKYEEALSHPKVVGLVIGTRPDTIDSEILDYIASLTKDYYVCVEYGVESVNDDVLLFINRGHDYKTAEKAIIQTAEKGIYTGAHLIFGLPGESRQTMLEGALQLSNLPLNILKLHQLQIIRDTSLADAYLKEPDSFRLYTLEEYLDFVVDVIENIRLDIYLERFVNQAPEGYLIAPAWGIKNFEFTAKLDKRLRERDTWQGKLQGAPRPE